MDAITTDAIILIPSLRRFKIWSTKCLPWAYLSLDPFYSTVPYDTDYNNCTRLRRVGTPPLSHTDKTNLI